MSTVQQRWGAVALVAALLVTSGCGATPAETGPQNASGGSKAPAAPKPAAFGRVDGGLVSGLTTTTFVDEQRKIRAEVPLVDNARNVSAAVQVVRDKMLRTASHEKASEVSIGWQLVSSGPGILGVVVESKKVVNGVTLEEPSAIWYDTTKKKVHSSPILVDRDKWGSFKNAVTKAATEPGIDKTKLSRALDSDAAPTSTGPAIGFDESGDAIVAFSSQAAGDKAIKVRVPKNEVTPLLSDIGIVAQQGAMNGQSFTGEAPPPEETPKPTPKATASGAANQVPRPSTTVGPDCSKQDCVALTYDDGPGEDTPKVLEAFRQENVPATFFQLGQMIKANPEIAKELAGSGHEIGSHSYSHPDLARISPAKMNHEISSTADLMNEIYGRKPMILRPPYGSHNKSVDAYAGGLGAAVIQWDTDTNDWKNRNTTATAAVAGQAKPGSVVLMHDIHPTTVAAAPEIIATLKKRNITLVTVTELSLNSGTYEAGHAYCSGTFKQQSGFNCAG